MRKLVFALAVTGVVLGPVASASGGHAEAAVAAAILALLSDYRVTAVLNVLATLLTLATAMSLFVIEPASGQYLLVDDLNKVFILLTTFVGFTTSIFSASYIGHEI